MDKLRQVKMVTATTDKDLETSINKGLKELFVQHGNNSGFELVDIKYTTYETPSSISPTIHRSAMIIYQYSVFLSDVKKELETEK